MLANTILMTMAEDARLKPGELVDKMDLYPALHLSFKAGSAMPDTFGRLLTAVVVGSLMNIAKVSVPYCQTLATEMANSDLSCLTRSQGTSIWSGGARL